MFKKIFGSGEEKKPQPQPKKPPQDDQQSKKIKIEAACNALDIKIAEF